jgi:hypothetical protein
MPPSYKTTSTIQGFQAVKQNLTRAFFEIFQTPISFSLVVMPNVGRVVAISNPRLLKVATGPAVEDFNEVKTFLAFLDIKFIDLNEVAEIFNENIVQLLNANKPEILFTPMADQHNNFYLIPTQYFYDHQSEMIFLLKDDVLKLLTKYLYNYQASILSLGQIFEAFKKKMADRIEDFDRCKLKNMSLMDFVKYNPTSTIDAFNNLFKTDKNYSPFVIVSKDKKIFHLDRQKNNELWGQYLISVRNLFLKTELESRKKCIQHDVFLGKKGLATHIQEGYKTTVDSLIYHASGFDKNEMNQAVLNAEKMVKEYHYLQQQCAEENFSKHDLSTIDVITFQKHIDVLTESLKIKFDFLGGNAVTLSMLKIRYEDGKIILDGNKSLIFAEIQKIFNETKAALKYLGESKISTVCANAKNSLETYITQRDKDEHDQQQQAIIAEANRIAKQEKEKARANNASSSSSSSSSAIASTTPLFKNSVTPQTLSTTDENVHHLGKSMGVDIYLNFNPANFIDDVPDVSVFTGDSIFKIADQNGGSGTKRLNLDPPVMLNCQIDGENRTLPITYEMKPHGTIERLLCVNLSCKGAILIIPVIYKKDGLHEKNDIASLQASSKNKVHVLRLSTEVNYPKNSHKFIFN